MSDEQQHIPLLAAKLHLPRQQDNLIPRTRLLEQLNAGRSCQLTLLLAPAGYGKTTLVRQWISTWLPHQQTSTLAWLSLDSNDNDPIRFWRYVISACQSFQSGLGQTVLDQIAITSYPPFKPLPLETILTPFLNELLDGEEQRTLVLEDFHVITMPAIHETLTFFLEHIPPTLRLLIITRSEPPLALARLRASGELCELLANDLRFSEEETSTFLQQILTSSLDNETLQRIDHQVAGWPAGLRLLALTLARRQARGDQTELTLEAFSGARRPLQEYVVSEILNAQPEPLQDFLLRTSTLSRLSASLCNAVIQRHDSEQILETLVRNNLFLEPLDDAGTWYHYHTLFAEAIQQEARRRLGSHIQHEISLAASLWYEQQHMLSEAVEAALQAQDLPRTITLIEQIVEAQAPIFGYSTTGQIAEHHTLCRWLEQIPTRQLQHHPELCMRYALSRLLLFITHFPPQQVLAQIDEFLQMAEEAWRDAGNTQGLGTICAFRALLTRQLGRTKEAVSWSRQALAWLPEDVLVWRGLCIGTIGLGEQFDGQLDRAREKLLEARSYCKMLGNNHFTRTNTGMLSGLYIECGELHLAAKHYQAMLAEARSVGDRDDIGHAQIGLAQIYYEWNELSAATQAAREAFELGQLFTDDDFQVQAGLTLARVEHAQGETTAAIERCRTLLAHLRPILHNGPFFTRLFRQVQTLQIRCLLAQGNLAAVQGWNASRQQDDEMLPQAQYLQEEQLFVRLLLAQNNVMEAREHLAHLLDTAQQQQRTYQVLQIQILMLLTSISLKQIPEARERLTALLVQTHTEGYQRLFLDEGEPVALLLRTLVPHLREQPLLTFAQTLLQAFDRELKVQSMAPKGKDQPPTTLIEPLSAQELRVLRLLVAGRSNAQIAAELIVSVNTIRSQIQSIYRKLDVNNRVTASEMARQLKLV
jgi:LuxR family maltose regulon positive regulatory protein